MTPEAFWYVGVHCHECDTWIQHLAMPRGTGVTLGPEDQDFPKVCPQCGDVSRFRATDLIPKPEPPGEG